MTRLLPCLALAAALSGCSGSVNNGSVALPVTSRASISSAGFEGNFVSFQAAISGDGRYVVFTSAATNLVASPAITGGVNVYRRDLVTQVTELVSVSTTGGAALSISGASAVSRSPRISDDGRHVAFESAAVNLVAAPVDPTPARFHIFRRDMGAGTAVMVDVTPAGAIPSTGSFGAAISGNGAWVAFTSSANNLVVAPAVTTGNHLYARDLGAPLATSMVMADTDSGGGESSAFAGVDSREPSLSFDGSFIAFTSTGEDMTTGFTPVSDGRHVYRRALPAGNPELVDISINGDIPFENGVFQSESYTPAISADGRFVAFASRGEDVTAEDDTNQAADVFVRDMTLTPPGQVAVERISVSSAQVQGKTASVNPRISGDGDRVLFSSASNNLVFGDTNNAVDVFLRIRSSGTTTRVSVSTYGDQTVLLFNSDSGGVSRDGRIVTFTSTSSNLVSADGNDAEDVFVKGPVAP